MSKENLQDINRIPVDFELEGRVGASAHEELEGAPSYSLFSLKASTRREERFLSFYLLYAIDRSDYSVQLDDVERMFIDEFDVKLPYSSFYKDLVVGVVEARDHLDELLVPYLKNWKLERLGCCTKLVLRLALWELLNTENASTVVINEAIELAKAFGERDAYKFINGVLDEFVKHLPRQAGAFHA